MQSLNALPATLHLAATVIEDDPVAALLLSKLPVAAVLLDAEGQVVQANMAGKAILDKGDGLLHRPGERLRASISYEDRRLREMLGPLLAAARRGDEVASVRPPLRVQRPSGRMPFLLAVDCIQTRRAPFGTNVALLVRIIDPEPEPEGCTYSMQAAFDLTAAEMRIAELIATGRSPGRAAEHLALSTNTVRTHLARIFDKTGVRSQHALVRLLMALGSWPKA